MIAALINTSFRYHINHITTWIFEDQINQLCYKLDRLLTDYLLVIRLNDFFVYLGNEASMKFATLQSSDKFEKNII